MKGRFNQVVGAISIALALLTPIVAELSPYAENTNGQVPGQLSNASPIIYVGPVYAGSHPGFLNPSGVNPTIFNSAAFSNNQKGMMISGGLYTPSMRSFMKEDPSAGVSRVTKKAVKIGLVNWP
jgi:hypothetical protein